MYPGGFGETGTAAADEGDKSVKAGSAEDAAFMLENAQKVIIVPGYGMAVAQAQHAVANSRHPDPRGRGGAVSPSTRWPAACPAT